MRRAFLAITGLAASTTALVVLKGSPGATPVAQDLPVERPPVVPAGSPGPTGTARATPSPTVSASADATGSPRPASTGRTPSGRTSTTARAASAPRTTTATPTSTTRRVTGPVVSNEYGNVQVQIVLSGSRIVDAVALELPQDEAQSDRRSDEVDGRYSGTSGQVVQQQSADLDTVSGATATSTSYRRSLQAAIDRAR